MICFNQKLVIFRLACCRSLIIQKIEAYRRNYFRMYIVYQSQPSTAASRTISTTIGEKASGPIVIR